MGIERGREIWRARSRERERVREQGREGELGSAWSDGE